MKEGFFKDIDIEDYHNWKKYPAVSSSLISPMINNSPLHCKARIDGKTKPPTKSMIVGSISHDILLENNTQKYEVHPDKELDKKTLKAWKEFEAEIMPTGKIPLLQKEFKQLVDMHDALMANSYVRAILENNTGIEVSGFWKPRNHNFWCKLRADIVNDKILMFADYKTTQDASPEEFSKKFGSYGYHIQAAHYYNGLLYITGREYIPVYIAQETNPPYAVCPFEVTKETIEAGQTKVEYAFKLFDECFEKDHWPGYPEFSKIKLSGWELSQVETIENRLKVMEDEK